MIIWSSHDNGDGGLVWVNTLSLLLHYKDSEKYLSCQAISHFFLVIFELGWGPILDPPPDPWLIYLNPRPVPYLTVEVQLAFFHIYTNTGDAVKAFQCGSGSPTRGSDFQHTVTVFCDGISVKGQLSTTVQEEHLRVG